MSQPDTIEAKTLPTELYEDGDVRALLDACGTTRTGRRNKALIALLAGAGLRNSEALDLEPRDVSFASGTLRVRRGKGGKARTVALDATTAALVEQWLPFRPEGAERLICAVTKGTPILPSYVRALLPRLAERAGIVKRVHPHGLRHYYACGLDRDGFPLSQISEQLGHRSAATTDAYLRRLRGADPHTAERLRARTWG